MIHIASLGGADDRIVLPAVELSADRVVLLDWGTDRKAARTNYAEVVDALDHHDVAHERRAVEFSDLFDALAIVGEAITDHADDDVYVDLTARDVRIVVGGMIACMTTQAQPFFLRTDGCYSYREAEPADGPSITEISSYPVDRPTNQHLRVMDHIATSDRTTSDRRPYRIKRELIEFGEREALPFVANYDGETNKGKFRRLKVHVVAPLAERGFVRVEEVGTQRRVFLTQDGRNVLRGFRHCLK